MWGPTQNVGPMCLVDLTFIRHKQRDRQTDKQSIYIDKFMNRWIDE